MFIARTPSILVLAPRQRLRRSWLCANYTKAPSMSSFIHIEIRIYSKNEIKSTKVSEVVKSSKCIQPPPRDPLIRNAHRQDPSNPRLDTETRIEGVMSMYKIHKGSTLNFFQSKSCIRMYWGIETKSTSAKRWTNFLSRPFSPRRIHKYQMRIGRTPPILISVSRRGLKGSYLCAKLTKVPNLISFNQKMLSVCTKETIPNQLELSDGGWMQERPINLGSVFHFRASTVTCWKRIFKIKIKYI